MLNGRALKTFFPSCPTILIINFIHQRPLLILEVQDWIRASFQIGVSVIIQLLAEGRLRHASGPAQHSPSPLHA